MSLITFLKKCLFAFLAFAGLSCSSSRPTSGANTTALSQTPVERYGQLRVAGNRIVDKNSNAVQLRGMSLFWSQWQGKYYNEDVVKWLKNDWKATVVRAAMGIESGGYLAKPEAEKQKVIAVVDAAIKEGLYVIIDWHDHNALKHVEESKAFFAEMAKRYGKYPNVIYEIFNEPLREAKWSSELKPYSETIIQAIRQYDSDNIIVCGTSSWSQRVDEAADDPIKMDNIAYTLHYYAATHKQNLRDIAAKALNKGVALFVTEFGTCAADGKGIVDSVEARKWWQFCDDNKLSWCNWSVADKVETASALSPNASTGGGWTEADITPSGRLVRDEMRAKKE